VLQEQLGRLLNGLKAFVSQKNFKSLDAVLSKCFGLFQSYRIVVTFDKGVSFADSH